MNAPRRRASTPEFNWLLDRLNQAKLANIRRSWRDHLFHFTDIKNVVSILNKGAILSRKQLERNDAKWQDAASSAVIKQTDDVIKDYVRLYFRPKTPTAYRNEGIRPREQYYTQDAHCPVPVYLIFDKRDIITLKGVAFSDGNLAGSGWQLFQSPTEFGQLPFDDIYSDGSMGSERKKELTNRRNAEVVVHDSLPLCHLKYIVCRSQAEYDTLKCLLRDKWPRWKDVTLKASNPQQLFHMKWLYILSCELTPDFVELEFNEPADPSDYGPFALEIVFTDLEAGQSSKWKESIVNVCTDPATRNLRFRSEVPFLNTNHYTLEVKIDGNLAYLGKYEPEIPF